MFGFESSDPLHQNEQALKRLKIKKLCVGLSSMDVKITKFGKERKLGILIQEIEVKV